MTKRIDNSTANGIYDFRNILLHAMLIRFYLIPNPLFSYYFGIAALSVTILYWRDIRNPKKYVRYTMIVAQSLITIRLIGLISAYIIVNSDPPPLGHGDVYDRLGLLAFACMPEPGIFGGWIQDRIIEIQDQLRKLLLRAKYTGHQGMNDVFYAP